MKKRNNCQLFKYLHLDLTSNIGDQKSITPEIDKPETKALVHISHNAVQTICYLRLCLSQREYSAVKCVPRLQKLLKVSDRKVFELAWRSMCPVFCTPIKFIHVILDHTKYDLPKNFSSTKEITKIEPRFKSQVISSEKRCLKYRNTHN